jgi:hypothetical protein
MNVREILDLLASNKSKKFKVDTLLEHEGNAELKEFFRLALDKSITFFIKKIPTYTAGSERITLWQAMSSLRRLESREVTGNAAVKFVADVLSKCSKDDAEVVGRILKRDPKCGVSFATVNSIWSGLVEVWPCMLCERSTEKNLERISYPAIAQEKSDGMRFNVVYGGPFDIEFRSRNGKRLDILGALDDEIAAMAEYVPCKRFVLDGEALIVKPEHRDTPPSEWDGIPEKELFESRKVGNGIFTKAIRGTLSREEAERIRLKLWDVIPYETFFGDEKPTVPYSKRIAVVKKVLTYAGLADIGKIGIVRTAIVKSEAEALKMYKHMLSRGKEGIIAKNMDSLFKNGRSKEQIKFKIEKELDMLVVDTYPHKKKDGWIGGLTVQSSDGLVKVNTGSGMKDKDRKMHPDEYVGKIVVVSSNGLIREKTRDTYSLFLPIFKGIRDDKDVADSYRDIKDQFDSI